MAGTIDRATLDRLIALGRERGALTASELQAALPVEGLHVDALVLLMLELEEAGVSVEPDAYGPRVEVGAVPVVEWKQPAPSPPGTIPAAGDGDGPAMGATRADPDPRPSPAEVDAEEGVGRVVLFAGLAVLLILGVILVLI